jgi:restriction endonuclease S subunit
MMKDQIEINNSAIRNPHSALPDGWHWVKLGEVIQEALPGFACGKRAGSDGFIQLRMNNISSHGQIDLSSILRVPATQEQVKKYRLVPGDVIFNNTNSVELVGKTALFNESEGIFLYSNHLTRLRSVPKILDTNYLASWLQLQWYQRVFEITCNRWIGQAAVQREKLLDFKIPLPPLLEQKRIATKIQEFMQEVDRGRTACEKQLEAAKALPSAHLRAVFESDEAKKWERRRLGEVCEFEYGSGLPDRDRLGGSFPVFGSNGVIGHHNVPITKGPTVVIGRKGSIGQVNYSEVPCWPIDTTYYIDASKTNHDLIWLYWLLRWLQLDSLNKATGVPGLNREDAYKLIVPLPSIPVQRNIATQLKEKMVHIEHLQSVIQNQQSAFDALPRAILRQAFNGEL